MGDKTTIMRVFNEQFFAFLDDISGIYPENTEIKVAITSFTTIKRANPTAIVKAWHKFVYLVYKDVIDVGNVDFFFEKDYSTDLNHLRNSNEIMKMIDKIREPLKGLSPENKDHCADYVKILSQLSVLYIK